MSGTERVVYIPGSGAPEKIKKALDKLIPAFTEYFRKIGIVFDNVEIFLLNRQRKGVSYE